MTERNGFRPTPEEVPVKAPDEPPGWFDKPSNVRVLIWIAIVAVLGLTVTDIFLHYHTYTGLENLPGYWTLFGLIASVLLIVVSKGLGKGLKREEDYYDE